MPVKTSLISELDLRSLAYAVLILEHGSFSVAGQVLDVRTSVVSRRARNLEDAIGVSLFDRSSKGVRVTIAGERVLRRGRAILAEIDTLKQTAALNPFSIVWSRQNSNPVFRRFLAAARLRAAERRTSRPQS